jgi:hypothetical protein
LKKLNGARLGTSSADTLDTQAIGRGVMQAPMILYRLAASSVRISTCIGGAPVSSGR